MVSQIDLAVYYNAGVPGGQIFELQNYFVVKKRAKNNVIDIHRDNECG